MRLATIGAMICRTFSIIVIMLNILLNVIWLTVIMLTGIMFVIIMQNVILLRVVKLSVIMQSVTGMSSIFIFVNTAPFIRPGRDGKKIPLPVNTVPFHSQNTVKCLNDRY
jgi:hypothetical protein